MNLIQWVDFKVMGDERGRLVALEGKKNIPFEIKRVYYLIETKPGVPRGFHAHKQLQQMAICLAGSCRMVMDDGVHREEVWMDSPAKGLVIGNMIWHEMHDFSNDCVLMILASEYYEEDDYIRKYGDFKRTVLGDT